MHVTAAPAHTDAHPALLFIAACHAGSCLLLIALLLGPCRGLHGGYLVPSSTFFTHSSNLAQGHWPHSHLAKHRRSVDSGQLHVFIQSWRLASAVQISYQPTSLRASTSGPPHLVPWNAATNHPLQRSLHPLTPCVHLSECKTVVGEDPVVQMHPAYAGYPHVTSAIRWLCSNLRVPPCKCKRVRTLERVAAHEERNNPISKQKKLTGYLNCLRLASSRSCLTGTFSSTRVACSGMQEASVVSPAPQKTTSEHAGSGEYAAKVHQTLLLVGQGVTTYVTQCCTVQKPAHPPTSSKLISSGAGIPHLLCALRWLPHTCSFDPR
jgi:hypothetical protein